METKSTHRRFFKLPTLILLLFSLCWLSNGYATGSSTTTPNTTALYLPTFSAIDAVGPVKIILVGQQARQSVTVFAPPEKEAQMINASVQNHTLMIDAHPPLNQPVPIVVKICMSQPLHSLVLRNSASVWGDGHLNSANLSSITLQGDGSVHLQSDTPALRNIQDDSSGDIAVNGVNNEILIVRGDGTGKITLSGRTQELNTQIGGSLLLQAAGLKAGRVHIVTKNNAVAYICPLRALYGFAYDNSTVYYYDNPGKLVRDTHVSGNVLKIIPERY